MISFAYYRLPYAGNYTLMVQNEGEPRQLASFAELDGLSGFVLAPFVVTDDCPVLIIRPDRVEERLVPACSGNDRDCELLPDGLTVSSNRATYAADFAACHSCLVSGEFSKIVLARSADVETSSDIDAEELFLRACRMYPRMFVVLVSTPQSGIWLAATPEILLDGSRDRWRTIALAGTMSLSDCQLDFDNPPSQTPDYATPGIFWDTKNIQEQRYVATYISESLKPFATCCNEEGPRTVRAGNLVHLRSDFNFGLAEGVNIGNVIDALHPTPAVCGLPKEATCSAIVNDEHTDRKYYSGFMGPLSADGDTHLYVSLRCMQIIDKHHCRLYAGGGLLKDSVEDMEWHETEAKMETMLRLL